MALAEQVAAVRRFNRFHTRLVGALGPRLAYADVSLPEARVVWELSQAPAGTAAKDLSAALSVDPGYLSRLIGRLERRGLVARAADGADARRRILSLTEVGRALMREMDAASAAEVEALLAPLAEAERAALAGALDRARRLLGDRSSAPLVLRPPRVGDLGLVVSRQAALYAQEYGWNGEFEGFLAEIVAAYLKYFKPGREAGWIAEIEGEMAGSVFVVEEDAETAKLRMLFVEPAARGRGVGRALVEETIRFARGAGYRRMKLWTNNCLHAARRIYEATGFRLVEREAHHSFGVDLVGEVWERGL